MVEKNLPRCATIGGRGTSPFTAGLVECRVNFLKKCNASSGAKAPLVSPYFVRAEALTHDPESRQYFRDRTLAVVWLAGQDCEENALALWLVDLIPLRGNKNRVYL